MGAGTGTTYTVRLGAGGSTATTLQNFALNVNNASNAALAGAAGNVTIGNVGDTGVLSLSGANSIGSHGGTLTVNNPISLGNNISTNFRGGSGTIVLNGSISGTGTSGVALAASGSALGGTSGTLTLAGNNSFAGNTSVNGAYILRLQHANALGAAGGTNTVNNNGAIEVAGGVTIASGESVTLNGAATDFIGALRAGSGGGTWAGGVSLGDTNVRIGALAAQTLTVTGTIANGGTGTGFNVSGHTGTGVVILNPTTSNSYTGTTGIIRGILRLGKTNALPTGTTLDVDSALGVTDAATFDLASFSQTVAVLQDSASTNINGIITNSVAATTSTLTVNQASNTTYDGIIQNGSGSVVLTKGGVGNLTLNGANIYTGGTNIRNGSITIAGGNDRLATGGSVVLGDVATSGKLVLGDATTASNQTLAGLTTTGLGGSVVGAHGTNNSVLTLNIASGTNSYAGALGGAGTNENRLALTKTGAGTLTLSNTNSYTGTTTINAGSGVSRGVILATATNALGTGAVTASFNTGATTAQIQLSGGITLGNSTITTTGDGSDGTVNGLFRSTSGANIISGTVTLGSGGGSTTFRADGGASLALNGLVNANAAGRFANLVGAGDFSFGSAGAINNGSGTLGLWSTNSGTTTINSTANNFTLATGIGNGNTLVVADLSAGGANSSIGAAGVAATNLIIDNGTLRYAGSTGAQSTNRLFSIGNGGATLNASGATAADTLSFTGTGALGFNGISGVVGTSALETGNRTLTLTGTNTGANTLDSVIGDQDTAGGNLTSLSKTDTGTWVVGGTNTYTGATTVTAGTLLINGNISTSTLTTVSGTGTLGGNGFVGNTQIQTGGTLSPGNSIDDIGINGSLTLDLGSFSIFEINTTGDLSDLAIVTGLLTFGGTLDVNNVGSPLGGGDTFNLFDFGTASGTFTTVNLPILGSGLTWDQSQLYTNGTLSIVPEPNVAALLGTLGTLIFLRRRRVA